MWNDVARSCTWRNCLPREASGPELLGLQLEEAERVVEPDDLDVLRVLFGREDASGALLSEILDAWSQVFADRVERRLELLQGLLFHEFLLRPRRSG